MHNPNSLSWSLSASSNTVMENAEKVRFLDGMGCPNEAADGDVTTYP